MDNSSLKQVPDSTDKKDTNCNSLAQWLMWKESIPAGNGCVKRKNNSIFKQSLWFQSYEYCLRYQIYEALNSASHCRKMDVTSY